MSEDGTSCCEIAFATRQLAWPGSDCHRQSFTPGPSSPCIYTRNKGTIQKDDAFPSWWFPPTRMVRKTGLAWLRPERWPALTATGSHSLPALQVPFHINQKNTGIARWAMPVFWCGRRDLNPYGVIHTPLKRARLPVPPLPRVVIDG